ncbi:nuclear transport factor 2 family protein [Solihabitans fulvus]|uniref:Nuclear transport factor 2 family protein n=1 Tax=Solihabitans fulvus TaxID=1892852 RepID=A0A5B2XVV3_9PSEU|nr:nuclear transport factor 2 family protein [Solihabitans fulvus]KAA2267130.1 nuclear transport factor 2 family protein [Solihabitans fulvus]
MSDALDLVRAHYAASDRGDVEGMLAVLAPGATWTEAAGSPYGGTYVGAEQIIDGVLARIGCDWADFTVTVEELVDGGTAVVALGRYAGTHRSTGQEATARFAHVWHVTDGQVSSFEQIADTAALEPR